MWNDIGGKISEQWRLVREAPVPYLAGLAVVAALLFGLFQWVYGRVLDNNQITITDLRGRITELRSEITDLNGKLAKQAQNPPQPATQPDPDAIYQFGANRASDGCP